MNGLTEINRPNHHCEKGAIYFMKENAFIQKVSKDYSIKSFLKKPSNEQNPEIIENLI